MVFRSSWLGAQTKATEGKAAEVGVPFIYLEDCYSWAGTALENSLCVQLIKRELGPKVKWHNIVCFEQRLFTVRRRVSNALGCESAVFPVYGMLMTGRCLGALQRPLPRAAQPPASPSRSSFLMRPSFHLFSLFFFHLVLFPKHGMQISRGHTKCCF